MRLGDYSLLLRVAIGGVLLLAGVGKLAGKVGKLDLGLVAMEMVVAVALLAGLYVLAASIAATALAMGYLAKAFWPSAEPCHCFGDRLPTTSRWGQRGRNSALAAFCGAQIAILLGAGFNSRAGNPALDIGLGTLAATCMVVLPWFVDWSSASA